ncbi:MAG: 6-phosphofructokinase [Peptoniphilaceae bacterium]|nr:6-phosphofructokinase [Peptoniphilaceae bacterium]MDD7433530.1 6-phosphofructokinase [Peptoniphilaceae bacterium]MDY3076280.1 6-phosphofructokinase [Peptoniphilaceae bacterium]MDY3987328.1 6-phosphofructokinase [Peptoniphilaceae bacterium]MDY4196921.1 6-phosphofructokinase [Peptoniphilaceae bacterium]
MKTIGILTSGGDAPGMNAAIRAIARTCFAKGIRVKGIRYGYEGLMTGDIYEMNVSSVGDIIQKGGTILGSARSMKFKTPEGQEEAVKILKQFGIEGLIVMGGDGSFQGAHALHKRGIRTVGIPCTIDNDMGYTTYTIGFHTAVETVIESIGKLRDTSNSHGRANIIEVMGRHCGDIALYSGLAGGAESIIVPEHPYDRDEIIERILRSRKRGKRHHIIVLAEGVGEPYDLRDYIQEKTDVETKITSLGHVQRGGSPSFTDAKLGCVMGYKAVEALMNGSSSVAVGIRGDEIFTMHIEEAISIPHDFNEELYEMANMLSN